MLGAFLARPVVLALTLALGLFVVGALVPTPQNWGQPTDERLVDVKATTLVQWDPGFLGGEWRVSAPRATTEESPIVPVGAWWHNTFSVWTSPERTVRVTLLDAAGEVVQSREEGTGEGKVLGSERTVRVVFHLVEQGDYTVCARVVDDADRKITEECNTTVTARLT